MFGAGWNVEEMENHGTSYKQRWKILRERVLAMREIWTREVAQFHGEFVHFEPLWSWPKPIQQPGPKILLGSRSQRCFERVVDYCDRWMPIGRPGEQNELAGGPGETPRALRACRTVFRFAGIGGYRFAPVAGLSQATSQDWVKHLIFSLPSGNAKQTMDDLDARAELAGKLGSIGA